MGLVAITRRISASLGQCELSFVSRTTIDVALARQQHAAYVQALTDSGCDVIELPAQDAMPDAVFIEDVALVLDEVAVMTRPGAVSRQVEGESVAATLAVYRRLLRIVAPGTLEGGDVLRVGRRIFVGQSARSNTDGISQLRDLVSDFGYVIVPIAMRDCLHLKSAVTAVADDTVLVHPGWVDVEAFAGFRIIEIDVAEEHAANALRVGEGILYPSCFPRTEARLREAGVRITTVDVSELQKAEGAVTCCSLVFEAD